MKGKVHTIKSRLNNVFSKKSEIILSCGGFSEDPLFANAETTDISQFPTDGKIAHLNTAKQET